MKTRRNLIRIERTRDDFPRLHTQFDNRPVLRRESDKKRRQHSTEPNNFLTFFERLFAALGCQVCYIQVGAEPHRVHRSAAPSNMGSASARMDGAR